MAPAAAAAAAGEECEHPELEFVGEQKTDEGVNTYFRCRVCKETIVVTPDLKAFAIKGLPDLGN